MTIHLSSTYLWGFATPILVVAGLWAIAAVFLLLFWGGDEAPPIERLFAWLHGLARRRRR